MNNKYKRLAKNSGIFMLANFGSKLISFILVPFYTHVLNTGDYGTVDALIATVSLLSPIATLGIGDVIIMFLSRKEYDAKKVFTNTAVMVLIGNTMVSLIYPVLMLTDIFKDYLWYFVLLVVFSSIYSILQMYARGNDKVAACGISGIVYTLTLASLNIYLLLCLKMGIRGYLLSTVFAYFVPSIYLFFVIKDKTIVIKYIDTSFIKKVLKLSLPLVPTTILWSLMNLADKYAIIWFVGSSGNGIYAVSHKLPSVISIVYAIFQQAWQLTTFELTNKEERSKTYSTIFEMLTCVMFCVSIMILIFNRVYITYFCESSYNSAWMISPILMYGSILNCISGLIGSNYLIMHNTKGSLRVTTIGAMINILLNFLLVPAFELYGAAIATTIGYMYMVLKKLLDTAEYTPMNIKLYRFIFSNVILIIVSVFVLINNKLMYYGVNCVALVLYAFLYREQFIRVKNLVFSEINRKREKG